MPGTIACIGCGNMGAALLLGLAQSFGEAAYHLCAYDLEPQRAKALAAHGVEPLANIAACARAADILLIAVKPYQVAAVLAEAKAMLGPGKTVLSIAAGVSLPKLSEYIQGACPVARLLPTTTALVGQGIFAFCALEAGPLPLPPERRSEIIALFSRLGLCLELPESKFNAFSALIGAGPAYVFAMIQGLVQAGVTLGFAHAEAREMVAKLFGGCAKMAQESGKPLGLLRDEVCSPGGLTIAGINVLDRAGLAGLLVEAVEAARRRGQEMEREA